jgi:hypothetical protein
MHPLQYLRLFSIFCALVVGVWIPLRLLGYHTSPTIDFGLDLAISVASVINIYLYFKKAKLSARKFTNWINIGLFLDLLCAMPLLFFDQFVFAGQNTSLYLINLFTARHILKIKDFLDEFDSLAPIYYRLVPIGLMLPVLVHLVACGWIALGSGTAGPNPDRWVEYSKAFYWAMTTLTTVGYGDISAAKIPQMYYAGLVQILGVGVFGFILSNVASILARLDAAREHHIDNLDKVETFLKSNQIPKELRQKVRGYYHYLWTTHRGYTNKSMLSDLPDKIQSELYFHIHRSILGKVPFLKGAEPELVMELMSHLEPKIFVPGQSVFKVDDAGDSMYFIQTGEVEVISRQKDLIATLYDGAFFGEMALLSDTPRSATVVAKNFTQLYSLSKESFEKFMISHPTFAKSVNDTMAARKSA